MSRSLPYLELIKFRYHISYLTVVFAASIFNGRMDLPLVRCLIELYLCFNVLFYGGIYTLNDLRDVESDCQHPRKKNRPIASGRVSPEAGRLFSVVLIAAGLGSVLVLFGSAMFFVCVAMLALNIFYSFVARNVPYLDIAINTATHPLRFLLGAFLAGRDAPLLHLGAYFCFVLGLSCLRRELEKDVQGWESRPTLKAYSVNALRWLEWISFMGILVFLALDGFKSPWFYTAIVSTYLVIVGGARFAPLIRSYLHYVWTR
jgi:decaprenyl-phosphate phosphoribosyltransferase